MKNPAVVAYYRVSTTKQGESGLGLEAQQRSVLAFTRSRNIQIIAEISEIETATNKKNRPKLQEALAICKRQNCSIIVSGVDRIVRNVGILGAIRNSGIEVLIADMPNANNFMINVSACFAEQEAESISLRTKAALQSAKERGTKLGSPQNLTDAARRLGVLKRQANSASRDRAVYEMVKSKRREGLSMQKIANFLNTIPTFTADGKIWYPSQVHRILKNQP